MEPFPCPLCEKRFPAGIDLETHLDEVHKRFNHVELIGAACSMDADTSEVVTEQPVSCNFGSADNPTGESRKDSNFSADQPDDDCDCCGCCFGDGGEDGQSTAQEGEGGWFSSGDGGDDGGGAD